MLDTVSCTTVRSLLPPIAEAIGKGDMQPVPGWRFWWSTASATAPGSSAGWKLQGTHEPTGLFVHGVPYELRGWSGSLPGILHGFNGVQLKSDSERDAALLCVHQLLNKISDLPRQTDTYRRLDIAVNVAHAEPERMVLALRNRTHPWIRRATEKYATGSIRFPGIEAVFQAYWKQPPVRSGVKRKAWKTPHVLRLELQLKTAAKIAQFLDLDEPPVRELPPMAVIYEKFRDFMLGFQRCEQRADRCSMAALLALCESRDLHLPGGETVMDWHRRSVGDSGHAKMRGKVAAITAQFLDIDWATLLPADTIPATVDVHPDHTTTLVPPSPIIVPSQHGVVATHDHLPKFQRGLVGI